MCKYLYLTVAKDSSFITRRNLINVFVHTYFTPIGRSRGNLHYPATHIAPSTLIDASINARWLRVYLT